MSELPRYIRDGVHLSTMEIEIIIMSICAECSSIKIAERVIYTRLTEFEISLRKNTLNDYEHETYLDWREVVDYFKVHKLSFERQFFKKKKIW
jgi:hypothetical protein